MPRNISEQSSTRFSIYYYFGYGPLSPITLHVSQQSLKSQLKSISNACKALELSLSLSLSLFRFLSFVSFCQVEATQKQTEMQRPIECESFFHFFSAAAVFGHFPLELYECQEEMRSHKKRQLANVFDVEMNYAKYHVVILCVNT